MSWLFSQALVRAYENSPSSPELAVASSVGTCWDGEQFVPSSENLSPQAYSSPGKTTAASRLSLCGMTCEPLTADRGEALLTSFREGSLARTSALPGKVTAWTANAQGSGRKWLGLLAKFDPDSHSWRTPQLSLLEGSEEFSETWPRWGSMRTGECWERQTWEPRTKGTASGSWPTPTATDFKSESMSPELVARRQAESNRGVRLTEFLHRKTLPTPTAGNDHSGGRLDEWGGSTNPFRGTEIGRLRLNPCWVEELMGWPTGSTAYEPLETARFREWRQLHGAS